MNGPSNEVALLRLMAIQGWMHVPSAPNGKPYGPKWFLHYNWNKAILSKNRRVTLRLARRPDCMVCGVTIPLNSTGDHIIPKSEGGPDDATNYLPLCGKCNSEKGKRDLFEWLRKKGFDVTRLDPDAICAYARLKFQHYSTRGIIPASAAESLIWAVDALSKTLPSEEHRTALVEATRGAA